MEIRHFRYLKTETLSILRRWSSPALKIVFLVLLGIWSFLISVQNSQFVDGLLQLPFRSLDDFSFQGTVEDLRAFWRNGNLYDLFGATDFGYGGLYWLLVAVITLPFHDMLAYQIAAPRFLSLAFSVGALLLIFNTVKKRSVALAFLFATSLMATSILIKSTYQFHHHTMLLFGSVLCMASYLGREGNRFYPAFTVVLTGLLLGVKATYLPYALFFLGLLAAHLYEKTKEGEKIGIKKVFVGLCLFLYSWVVAVAPVNAFILPVFDTFPRYFNNILFVAEQSSTGVYALNMKTFQEVLSSYQFGLWATALAGGLLLAALATALKKKDLHLGLCGLGVIGYVSYIFLMIWMGRNSWDLSRYLLPGVPILFLCALLLYLRSSIPGRRGILTVSIAIWGLCISSSADQFVYNFSAYTENIPKELFHKRIHFVEKVKEFIDPNVDHRIWTIDYRFPKFYGHRSPKRFFEAESDWGRRYELEGRCNFVLYDYYDTPPEELGLRLLYAEEGVGKVGVVGEACPER